MAQPEKAILPGNAEEGRRLLFRYLNQMGVPANARDWINESLGLLYKQAWGDGFQFARCGAVEGNLIEALRLATGHQEGSRICYREIPGSWQPGHVRRSPGFQKFSVPQQRAANLRFVNRDPYRVGSCDAFTDFVDQKNTLAKLLTRRHKKKIHERLGSDQAWADMVKTHWLSLNAGLDASLSDVLGSKHRGGVMVTVSLFLGYVVINDINAATQLLPLLHFLQGMVPLGLMPDDAGAWFVLCAPR